MREAYSVLVLTARQLHVGRVWVVLMLALHRQRSDRPPQRVPTVLITRRVTLLLVTTVVTSNE